MNIKHIPVDELDETMLNDLLVEDWKQMLQPTEIVCTYEQKRKIVSFCSPVPLKRTLLDRLLFRTRYSNGQLYASTVTPRTFYQSDVGTVEIKAER